MANSKLLKEAIADAKAVREIAIANAKIALEEAFTPRLQSILSKKLQAEMEGDDVEIDESDDESTEFDMGDDIDMNNESGDDYDELSMESSDDYDLDGLEEDDDYDLDGLEEDDDMYEFEDDDMDSFNENDEMDGLDDDEFEIQEEDEMDDDELDLESVIRELEQSDDDYSDSMDESDEFEDDEIDLDEILREMDDVDDVEFDTELDEILREMGYGDTEETDYDVDANEQLQHELDEAYGTIKSLRKTINEVNLLNAKLLYANRLFRNYNLNNEQKVKVVENLDRTTSVREVKLVYATLAESMKFSGTGKRGIDKRAMVEGLASRAVASTAPKREIISESNQLANRFKKLAGII